MNDPEASIFPGVDVEDRVGQYGGCGCWTCVTEHMSKLPIPDRYCMPFIVCPTCGNKRCPKATHHDQACTGSNDPLQPGSRYGGLRGRDV